MGSPQWLQVPLGVRARTSAIQSGETCVAVGGGVARVGAGQGACMAWAPVIATMLARAGLQRIDRGQ